MESAAQARYTITLDDDPSVHALVAAATGIESKWFASCEELDRSQLLDPAAVFLDVKLSVEATENGQLIPKLKDNWPLSPIILTAPQLHSEMLTEAMALGADDFIMKPLAVIDLQQRFQVRKAALEKRAARETIMIADMTIDTLQRSVVTQRGQKFLSPTEVKLLSELAKARGNVVPRELLKNRCWPQMRVSDNALNRKLYEIRRRIKPLSDAVNIRTIYGVGFVMEEK
jgi:DNA-binding response OmpR family regulator